MGQETAKRAHSAHHGHGLSSKARALRAAQVRLGEPDAGAEDTIFRLSQQLVTWGRRFGLPDVEAASAAVIAADPGDLGEVTTSLIAALDRSCPIAERESRLLLVDDDEHVRALVAQAVAEPARQLLQARNIQEASEILWQQALDLVVLDLGLPDGDGRDLLADMSERSMTADVPVIVLSGQVESHVKSECIALGVDRFLEKPVDLPFLATAVAAALERRHSFQDAVGHDQLTGIKNRSGFRRAYGQAVSFCRRRSIPLSIAILDIDHFKAVNDTHGHAVGDDALVFVSDTLIEVLREADIIGRWGGEEFVICLPGTTRSDALIALERVQDALGKSGVPLQAGGVLMLTLSGGVVELAADESLDDALKRADELLYVAKSSGRRQIIDSAPSVHERKPHILLVEDDVETADAVREFLQARQFDVSHVRDGASAIAAAQAAFYDLILLDKLMPDVDGFDVLTRLRAQPSYAKVPIIMITATDRDREIEEAFSRGADDYIQKPFGRRELMARVRRHLKRSG